MPGDPRKMVKGMIVIVVIINFALLGCVFLIYSLYQQKEVVAAQEIQVENLTQALQEAEESAKADHKKLVSLEERNQVLEDVAEQLNDDLIAAEEEGGQGEEKLISLQTEVEDKERDLQMLQERYEQLERELAETSSGMQYPK